VRQPSNLAAPSSFSIVVAVFAPAMLLFVLHPASQLAQSPSERKFSAEKTFFAPGDAAPAPYRAAKPDDSNAMSAIFGSNASKILHTDDVADNNALSKLVNNYDQMLRDVIEPRPRHRGAGAGDHGVQP
jgi:hypothetical protein